MRIGFMNGMMLGILNFLFIGCYVWLINRKISPLFLCYCCLRCLSLLVAMMISSMVGIVVPMFFHKIKAALAVASRPLITTINDLVAVLTFMGCQVSYCSSSWNWRAAPDHHVIVGAGREPLHFGKRHMGIEETVYGVLSECTMQRTVIFTICSTELNKKAVRSILKQREGWTEIYWDEKFKELIFHFCNC